MTVFIVLSSVCVKSSESIEITKGMSDSDKKIFPSSHPYFKRSEIKSLEDLMFEVKINDIDVPSFVFAMESPKCHDLVCTKLAPSDAFFRMYSFEKFSAISCNLLEDSKESTIFYFGKYASIKENLRLGQSRHTKKQLEHIVDCVINEFKKN